MHQRTEMSVLGDSVADMTEVTEIDAQVEESERVVELFRTELKKMVKRLKDKNKVISDKESEEEEKTERIRDTIRKCDR